MERTINYDGIRIDIREGASIAEEMADSGALELDEGVAYIIENQQGVPGLAALIQVVHEDYDIDGAEVVEEPVSTTGDGYRSVIERMAEAAAREAIKAEVGG